MTCTFDTRHAVSVDCPRVTDERPERVCGMGSLCGQAAGGMTGGDGEQLTTLLEGGGVYDFGGS